LTTTCPALELDVEEFVAEYWQKKPCLLRNALPGFESIISPEELAGLACEEDVHCRLVQQGADAADWSLRYGPFAEHDFLDLPESNYSLLVSECEKWMPELNELLARFRFIPDWRLDDLMISYAPAGGSVGPHVDQYDVFLLQALGSRRWQYRETPSTDAPTIPGLELAILQEFSPDQDVVLKPGDILYLPPGFAHHGVALERCMTYSIGYRAPNAANVLESFALESERLDIPVERYGDAELELERHHAEITDAEIERFRRLATRMLEQSPVLWRDAVGKMLSDSAVAIPAGEEEQAVSLPELLASEWMRHPETRLYFHLCEHTIEIYFNGSVHSLARQADNLEQLHKLCENYAWSHALIQESIQLPEIRELLLELATKRAILPVTDQIN
jgi:50S ribosomal protein L16 3-hydroxylase